jgi:tripartite-type tricarboxylate transporter receptor subunit TctC
MSGNHIAENEMKRICVMSPAALALALAAVAASAQTWPAKPIRVIVPFGAGSLTDVVPRLVFDQVGVQLRQTIVVENRGGAGGTIGTAAVAKADPDGHTLLANSSAHTIAPAIYPNLSYDTARDLSAVVSLGQTPMVMIIALSKGFKTVGAYVAAAKATPGSVNFASAGVGTATHLAAERFIASAGFKAVHVPFKGGPEALTAVIAGQVDFYFCPIGTALPQVRGGKVLALAVSSPKRAAALPDVPSTLEAGLANSDYSFWVGVFAPAKTPRDVIDRLNQEAHKSMQLPRLQARLAELGMEPMVMRPTEFDAQVKKEIVTSAALAKAAGLKQN